MGTTKKLHLYRCSYKLRIRDSMVAEEEQPAERKTLKAACCKIREVKPGYGTVDQ
jgi:hypothetical protein